MILTAAILSFHNEAPPDVQGEFVYNYTTINGKVYTVLVDAVNIFSFSQKLSSLHGSPPHPQPAKFLIKKHNCFDSLVAIHT